MRIDCDGCGTVVDASIKGHFTVFNEFGEDNKEYSILQCPSCDGPILISRDLYYAGGGNMEYAPAKVLYPKFTKKFETEIPDDVQFNYEEAERCLKVKAYTALVIMCRRTLESVCDHFKCKKGDLYNKLQELEEKSVIDKTISEWATMLRLEGNSAAHDVAERVPAEDAKDILDFTHGLIEYVFSYKKKFSDFQRRKLKRDASRISGSDDTND